MAAALIVMNPDFALGLAVVAASCLDPDPGLDFALALAVVVASCLDPDPGLDSALGLAVAVVASCLVPDPGPDFALGLAAMVASCPGLDFAPGPDSDLDPVAPVLAELAHLVQLACCPP